MGLILFLHRPGSVICDHTVNFDTNVVNKGNSRNVTAIANTIQEEIETKVVPHLSKAQIANSSVNIQDFKASLGKGKLSLFSPSVSFVDRIWQYLFRTEI